MLITFKICSFKPDMRPIFAKKNLKWLRSFAKNTHCRLVENCFVISDSYKMSTAYKAV